MPELPEVETVSNTLKNLIQDLKIIDIDILYSNIIVGDDESFKRAMIGQHFRRFLRRGKYLIFEMDDVSFVSHLRMEGKYYYEDLDRQDDKHTHVIFYLDNGKKLAYHDTRKFGRMELIAKDNDYRDFKALGPEPFSDDFNVEYCLEYLASERRTIKAILLDQAFVAGIGNIYADEIIFATKIHPELAGRFLDAKTIANLIKNTRMILESAIKMGGTTIRSYTSSLGVNGRFQLALKVHQRQGLKCPVCGSEILKSRVAQRGTYFCPTCQVLPYRVGITGTIGSGKSLVLKYLKDLGYPTFSADQAVNELYEKGHRGYMALKVNYPELFNGDDLDKAKLADFIFSDNNNKVAIEKLIHPLVLDMLKAQSIDKPLFFGEIPLMYEAGFDKYFDEVVLISSDESKIYQRLKERGLSAKKAKKRIASQMSEKQKLAKADLHIANNGTKQALYDKINIWIDEVYARTRSL